MPEKKYDSHYSEEGLFRKLSSIPVKGTGKIFEQALLLYVLLTERDIPVWLKVSIITTLGYFIYPIDFIPDLIPGGYLDDLAAMALLVGEASIYATASVKARVQELLPDYFKTR